MMKAMFGDLALEKEQKDKLDGFMTDVVTSIKDLEVTWNPNEAERMSHVVTFYYATSVTGLDPRFKVMKVRNMLLSISEKTWEESVNKAPNKKQISFEANILEYNTVMNSDMVTLHTQEINQVLELLAGDKKKVIDNTKVSAVRT
jgi:ADP-ribose pyrophosphatase YjhB (NUDIX family)